MITYRRVRWKNLLSTGNVWTEIQLDRSKTTLLVGQNGAGKSTFLDALSFGLYGKAFRDIRKDRLINSINGRECLVEVEFDTPKHTYIVRRGIKPNLFEIIQDGVLINQDASVDDYQELLERHILRMSHKAFSQITVLGSAQYVPFMELKAAQRRDIIEDILDIQVFTMMGKLLKEKIAVSKEELSEAKLAISTIRAQVDSRERLIRELTSQLNFQQATKQSQVDVIQSQIADLNTSIEEVECEILALQAQLTVVESSHKTSQQIIQVQERIFNLRKEIQFFREHAECPSCKQQVSIEHQSRECTVREERIEKLNGLLDTLQTKSEAIAQAELENQKIAKSVDALIVKRANLTTQLGMLNTQIQDIESVHAAQTGIVDAIDREKTDLKELNEELERLVCAYKAQSAEHDVLQYANTLLKDTGIRASIIKQYVPVINGLINAYLRRMEFFCHFELDEQFNETIKSRYRDDFTYQSFSEGEKQRINIAILFAWITVARLRNSQSTNLLVMDEIFDSSLDANGVEEVLKLFEELDGNMNLFVVSHRGDALFEKFHSVIKFGKIKNFSQIIP